MIEENGEVVYHQMFKDLKDTLERHRVPNELFISQGLYDEVRSSLGLKQIGAENLVSDLHKRYIKGLAQIHILSGSKQSASNSNPISGIRSSTVHESMIKEYKQKIKTLELESEEKARKISSQEQRISTLLRDRNKQQEKNKEKVLSPHDSDKLLHIWTGQRGNLEHKIAQLKSKLSKAMGVIKKVTGEQLPNLKSELNGIKNAFKIESDRLKESLSEKISLYLDQGENSSKEQQKEEDVSNSEKQAETKETVPANQTKEKEETKPNVFNSGVSLFSFPGTNSIFNSNSQTPTSNIFSKPASQSNPFGNVNAPVHNPFSKPPVAQVETKVQQPSKDAQVVEMKQQKEQKQQKEERVQESVRQPKGIEANILKQLRNERVLAIEPEIEKSRIELKQAGKRISQYRIGMQYLLGQFKSAGLNKEQFQNAHDQLLKIIQSDQKLRESIEQLKQIVPKQEKSLPHHTPSRMYDFRRV